MLNSFFLKSLEQALNRYLALDPESSKRLQRLQDQTITIELLALHRCFQLTIREKRIYVTAGETLPAAIKIRGTPLNLFTLALSQDKKQHFLTEAVILEGDAELGQQITDLFDHLDLDWEEYAAQYLGDLPAHQLGRLSKKFFAWGKTAHESLLQDLNDYLHEEKRWFPPAEALADFFREIDDLRLDIDRLEARVNRLQAED